MFLTTMSQFKLLPRFVHRKRLVPPEFDLDCLERELSRCHMDIWRCVLLFEIKFAKFFFELTVTEFNRIKTFEHCSNTGKNTVPD